MRAAVLHSTPGEVAIEDVDIADPGPREVRLRTAAAGVCHCDLHFVEGKYDHLPEAAFYMVGTIEEAVEKGKKLAAEAA